MARNDGGMPQWLILIIIMCSGFGFVVLVLALGRIVRIYQQSQAAGEPAMALLSANALLSVLHYSVKTLHLVCHSDFYAFLP